MIAHTYEIQYKFGDVIKIACISDVHLGARSCDEKQFRKDINRLVEDPAMHFIFIGDMSDSIVCTDKRHRPSNHVEPGRDDVIDYEVDRVVELLKPCMGRIIGYHSGNHEDTITSKYGTNPASRVASSLEAKYLGYSSMTKLLLYEEHNGKHARGKSVIIHSHHGHGGGSRTAGGNITKFDRDRAHYEADIYLRGHVHQKYAVRQMVLAHGGERIIEKPQILALCGTYMKTLSQSTDPTYSEKKGFPPTEIGCVVLHIKPLGGSKWVDMWTEA